MGSKKLLVSSSGRYHTPRGDTNRCRNEGGAGSEQTGRNLFVGADTFEGEGTTNPSRETHCSSSPAVAAGQLGSTGCSRHACTNRHLLYVVQDALGVRVREVSVNQAFNVHPDDGKTKTEGKSAGRGVGRCCERSLAVHFRLWLP